jgi:hypothetical protein
MIKKLKSQIIFKGFFEKNKRIKSLNSFKYKYNQNFDKKSKNHQ